MKNFEQGALDLIHEAHRETLAAVCDYESFRGFSEGSKPITDGQAENRHVLNARSMANAAIKSLQAFLKTIE